MASVRSAGRSVRASRSRHGSRPTASRGCRVHARRTPSAICGSPSTCRRAGSRVVICRAMGWRGCLAAASVAAAFCMQAADAAAADVPVGLDAGAVRVEVRADPFQLSLVDTADGDRLATLPGAAPASPDDPRARYGSPGFAMDRRQPGVNNPYLGYYVAAEANTLWFHATKLASSKQDASELHLVADTNDPVGNQLAIDVRRVADGALSIEATVVGPLAGMATTSGAAFEAAGGERYLGFGSRSNAVDQTGNHVFSWAEEGPFSGGDYDAEMHRLVPDFTLPTGPTTSNFPIPWLVSTRGFGVLIDQPQ